MSDPWPIPRSWAWARTESIAAIVGGGTPDTQRNDYFGGDIAWLTPADLSGYTAKHVASGARSLTEAGYQHSGAQMMPAGTVVFSSRAPIGYVAIASSSICTNQGFKSFVPEPGISSDYLYYYLHRAKPLAMELASGTTFLEISGKRAAALPVPVPSLSEQKRIAEKLDELLSDLDAGVAALERVRTKLKHYRSAVLKAAVEGALTAEWRRQHPAMEPASELLKRILTERRRRWEEAQLKKFKDAGKSPPKHWESKYSEPIDPDSTDLPPLPQGWCWAKVEQLAWASGYGTSEKCSETNAGIAVLRIPNVIRGRIDLADLKFARSRYAERDEDLADVGDLFVIRTNGSRSLIGRGAVVREKSRDPLYFASYLIRLRIVPNSATLGWVALLWESPVVRQWIEARAATSAGQYNISLSVLQT